MTDDAIYDFLAWLQNQIDNYYTVYGLPEQYSVDEWGFEVSEGSLFNEFIVSLVIEGDTFQLTIDGGIVFQDAEDLNELRDRVNFDFDDPNDSKILGICATVARQKRKAMTK